MNEDPSTINTITTEILTWLDCTDFDRPLRVIRAWGEPTWQVARQAAIIQGIGPYFSQTLPKTPLAPFIPGWFYEWLAQTYKHNTARIELLLADLQILLREAHRAGIPVLPLKGSLLAPRFYPQPGMRTMADIDLLVHPKDRYAIQEVLETNGYRLANVHARWMNHDMYANKATESVVSLEEHPDNPRHIEIHFNLDQELWSCFPMPDMSAAFWQTNTVDTFLGEPAHFPTPENHLAFIALHHLRHLFFNSGRAIQWLDIAIMAKAIPNLRGLPYPNLVYPALKFAARVFPSYFSQVDWQSLGEGVHPRVRHWGATAPLGVRSGLQMMTKKNAIRPWRLRWIRWHPTPVRLALTYPDSALPAAYLRYGMAVIQHATKKITAKR